jgi:shikimate 5-dehydrogenase
MSLVSDLAPLAQTVGAVNTIARTADGWYGTNTDVDGFLDPLAVKCPIRGLRATVLGAGGAARAVGHALRREGADVRISARRSDAASVVARDLGGGVAEWPPADGSWDLLVNATPIGSRAVPGSPLSRLPQRGVVYDLIYDPNPTTLMKMAAEAGCDVIGGLDMLVAQAERQFEIWTGQRPPVSLFGDAAVRAIRNRES